MRSLLLEPKHSNPPQTARHAALEPMTTTQRFDSFRVLLGSLLFLVLAAFLTSAKLVEIAERMEFGSERDRWLSTAQVLDEASTTLYLDKPGQWIRSAVNYNDGTGVDGPSDGVVIGDLAAIADDEPLLVESASTLTGNQSSREEVTLPPELVPGEAISGETPSPAPEPEVEPEPEIPPLREISGTAPLRMWLGGDSLGQFMAAHIAYRIAPPERTDIDIDYHISTGLARPDYFDWPSRLTNVISSESRPEAIVYMVGGNDDQAMRLQSAALEVSTPEWQEEYRRRVGLMMDVTAYADTRLIWVLLPPMKDERRELISNQINGIVMAQAAQRPWVSVIDIDDLFVDDAGTYSQFVNDPAGEQQLARQGDGVHITEIGSRWVADRLWAEIMTLWETVGTPAEPAPVQAPADPDPTVPPPVSPDE